MEEKQKNIGKDKTFISEYWIVIGIIISIIYFILALLMLQPIEHLKNIFELNLDGLSKLGSFLAGVFSPLAFAWLIVGYVMQQYPA
ncbi:hypothetical protein [Marinomonas sp.]|uniref:hypothetical protein n=1 Tax=Marinomonas sp. TaxID=1904862 RepID=UPI003BA8CC57